jgi:hypothetical protein
MISRPRRSTQLLSILLVIGLFGLAAGAGAVGVNAFGAGDKFDRLLAKIDRFVAGPPPDRPTVATVDVADPGFATSVLDNLDLDRAVDLVRQVCRIPSVLGDEGELAAFLAAVMRESGFGSVELQDVLPGRPNALGEVSFGPGPRVVLTGHLDTKPESHGWQRAAPFSGDLIDGAVYGHGVMDMKAALACQIVAIEAVKASQLPLSGTVAMAAVADHMGEQAGSVAYFDTHQADLCLLGELGRDLPRRALLCPFGARVRLHVQEVDDAGQLVLCTDRQVHGHAAVGEL